MSPATRPFRFRTWLGSLAVAAVVTLLVACGSAPHKPSSSQRRNPASAVPLAKNLGWSTKPADAPPADAANDVLFRAIGLVGTPYRWGGNTPQGGFDCSGLINYIYLTSTGLRLPRTSAEMAALDKPKVDEAELSSGDLVFFGRGHITHVGVYVGKGRFVHAPNSGGTVRLDDLDGAYWKENFAYGRRVLN
ncbi:cell wall-associated NlpC family hydrolase [Luteibacter jiangsuensis]|uniref:Cell wall-associated NlpC family hydrolase n=1 Tax=Luteibacter jiangsuensis TaxID=637577 RepID=A0ABT9T1F9_9GAMM|nr:C40 family peptidase [Luteibacter jiangsuensis]MDQ0011113.1 cell wall-associated NlpC family hydrolase [Luteibacter jiangsuensis]